jgi:hypothetical protein
LGRLAAGTTRIDVVGVRGEVVIDGIVVVAEPDAQAVAFPEHTWNPTPTITRHPAGDSLTLEYDQVAPSYGLAWDGGPSGLREFLGDNVDSVFRQHNYNYKQNGMLAGDGKGHYTSVLLGPITVAPQGEQTCYGTIVAGATSHVERVVAAWSSESSDQAELAARFAAATAGARLAASNPSGETFRFSQERMAATMATNVVYPIRTRGRWIRHYTPGRFWDSLYTMDSGMVGLGLAELDVDRSIDVLNAYLTAGAAEEPPFIHHGSVVPVQFYQFVEIWNRIGGPDFAEFYYPRLQRYYRFLAGHDPRSTTRPFTSNLLCTWDYWINTGWDDYPPQVHTSQHNLRARMAPVVITAHAIRCARILRMIAAELNLDGSEYDSDIAMFAEALQDHAWDAESEYFSYMVHDEAGDPVEFLHHASGRNFNMGLDGASPLLADVCTPAQEAALLAKLTSEAHLWSPHGLTSVDQAAPYFSAAGMFNGGVWMIHQWFLWKTYLSLGYAEEARKLAATALELWKTEVEATYNCYEHFNVRTGRGGGWHHFGGLSAPVLSWFHAYHVPGRLTVGLDTVVRKVEFNTGRTELTATLRQFGSASRRPVVLAVLQTQRIVVVTWNDEAVEFEQPTPGTAEIRLPTGDVHGVLRVAA